MKRDADNEVDAWTFCLQLTCYSKIRHDADDEVDDVYFELAEVVIGNEYVDAFPPLRPLTTSLHVSPSDTSASLDDWPGSSLKSDSSLSESYLSVSRMWDAPDLFNLSPCP